MFGRVRHLRVQVELFPLGPPEHKYGATFGEQLRGLFAYPPPGPDALDQKAHEAIIGLASGLGIGKGKSESTNTLFLATTSALDGKSLGPHVGDYHNMLFKRAILKAGHPVVFFADASKIESRFDKSKCFWVCGSEKGESWPEICEEVPIACCLGFIDKKRRQQTIAKLSDLGLIYVAQSDERKTYNCVPLLIFNDKLKHALSLDSMAALEVPRKEKPSNRDRRVRRMEQAQRKSL